jgi:hypothetical protein
LLCNVAFDTDVRMSDERSCRGSRRPTHVRVALIAVAAFALLPPLEDATAGSVPIPGSTKLTIHSS